MGRNKIELYADEIIHYMINTNSTIRQCAKYFGCSKSLIESRLKSYNGKNKEILEKQIKHNLEKKNNNILNAHKNRG